MFSDLEKRRHATLQGPPREAPGSDRRQSRKGNVARSLYCGFHEKEWEGRLKLSSLKSFVRIWNIGVIPCCVVPGARVVGAVRRWLECGVCI